MSVPLGRLADRVGAKRMWQVTSAVEAAALRRVAVVGGFWQFVAMMIVMSVVEAGRRSGRGAYTIAVFPREERVRSQAYMRAARNVGYTLGALAAGIALATGRDEVVQAVPLLTAFLLALNAWWVFKLPDVTREPSQESVLEEVVEHAGEKRSALHNRGFFLMSICNGVLGTHGVLLNVVIGAFAAGALRGVLVWGMHVPPLGVVIERTRGHRKAAGVGSLCTQTTVVPPRPGAIGANCR